MGLLVVHPDVPGLVRRGEFIDHLAGLTGHPVGAGVLQGDGTGAPQPAAGKGRVGVFGFEKILVALPADVPLVAEVRGLTGGGHVKAAQVGRLIAHVRQVPGPAPGGLYRGGGQGLHLVVVPGGPEGIGMPPAEKGLPGRGAHRHRGEGPGVYRRGRGQTIQIRGLHRMKTPKTDHVMPQLVRVDDQQIHISTPGRCRRASGAEPRALPARRRSRRT